ncbi:hypothetical protein [Pseudomonas brassicacearum]|uniref:hypothetical protein n=1 Tax=Pseudomonas brassicacearum TaxID=930166 RepID=UPI00064064A1|nr:hypothetical protein [Pseudomonas brassicacearum]
MWQLFYVAVAFLLLGCDSQLDAAKKGVSSAPQAHERTLQYTVAFDGSQTIQAILITNGKDAIDVAVDADSLRSRAGFMTQIAFKDCGRVNFARTGPGADVVQAIPTGRGMTAKCQIQNWEGQWKILQSK